ncbi:MAG: hypothetical protein E7462_00915 [Ruminococcaceae bacterium]|nr:hypothetical protein [Oscillospiraceae bacterium]
MHKTSVQLEQIMPLIRQQLASGESVKFTPQGTSMRPTIWGGRDQVVLSPLPGKLKKYDIPLYLRDNGHFVLHRIVKVSQCYTCVGDNQVEYEHGVRQDQLIAVVTAFVRKGKLHSVNSLDYRIYCRVWHYTRFLRRLYRAIKWKICGPANQTPTQ